jgi:reverse gyrase
VRIHVSPLLQYPSAMNKRYEIESVESEINNLYLLNEYGRSAWAEDNNVSRMILDSLHKEQAALQSTLQQLEAQRVLKEEKVDKQLAVIEKDLFNYIQNSGRTLVQIRTLEKRARELLSDIDELGIESSAGLDQLKAEIDSIW